MTTLEGETLSFKDKRKFFEQEIQEQSTVKPKSGRKFSYLQDHEVAQMRSEEEKKLNASTTEELMHQYLGDTAQDGEFNKIMSSLAGRPKQPPQPPVKTVKAERREQNRLSQEENNAPYDINQSNSSPQGVNQSNLSPQEERAVNAQKRTEWRQARMKSLEADALRAQAVIAKVEEMKRVDEAPQGSPASYENGSSRNGTTNGHE